MLDPIIQVLLLVVGALLTTLSTVAISMQVGSKKTLTEMARDVRDIGEKLADQALLVARDYMTHDQHERYHAKDRHDHE